MQEHQPAGATEAYLLEELEGIIWRKRRVLQAEGANINQGLRSAVGQVGAELGSRTLKQEGLIQMAKRKAEKPDPNALRIDAAQGDNDAELRVQSALRPTVQAAITLKQFDRAKYKDLGLTELVDALSAQTKAVIGGDMRRGEAMLTAQAHTLDAIFHRLSQLAIGAEYIDHLDRFLKLSLRAQSQCRATWEALATIKNPPVMGYVRQANIAHGPQQVNNASAAPDGAPREGENPNLQNKLLEEKDGERLDTGTTGTPGRADPAMAPVGEVDRAEDRGR